MVGEGACYRYGAEVTNLSEEEGTKSKGWQAGSLFAFRRPGIDETPYDWFALDQ